jgi:hypothetical protein
VSANRAPAAQFPRQTLSDLADALGVHRNTCTAWASAGAPPGPPYCELAWRTWAAAGGRSVSRPPEQALLELLAGAGVAEYRRQLEAQRQGGAAPGAGGGGSQTTTTATDWEAVNKRLEAEKRQLDLDKARRRLVPIEDVHRLVGAIAQAGAQVFADAPRLVEQLPLSPADRARLQSAIEEALAQRRADLVARLDAELRRWLEEPRP